MARTKADSQTKSSSQSSKSVKSKSASKSGQVEQKERKPVRYRPGTVALRNIRKYQKNYDPLLSKAPFRRLVRQYAQEMRPDLKFSENAMTSLQELSENHLQRMISQAYVITLGNDRIKLRANDLEMVQRIRRV